MRMEHFPEYEGAAREYCRAKGLDPEKRITINAVSAPAWMYLSRQLREHDLVNKALAAAPPEPLPQEGRPRG